MSAREHIPNELQRQLMLEVGYRCPLCKQTEPLEFEHIEEWATVQKHEFTNMIVLCPSCHGRKKDTNNPRHINKASLKKLKQSLMLLNGRYSDLERRLVDEFQNLRASAPTEERPIIISDIMRLLVKRLEEDGLVSIEHRLLPIEFQLDGDGLLIRDGVLIISLTDSGKEFIRNLIEVTAV